MEEDNALVTAKELADSLRLSTRTLRRFIQMGRIPYVRIGGPKGPIRFRRRQVMNALAVEVPAKK